jgi:hypothetical protein
MEVPSVGMPDVIGETKLYWADRGDIIWQDNPSHPEDGIYITDRYTGTARRLLDNSAGSLVGLDARNVYAVSSFCSTSACPFTIYGFARDGGTPFVAYETADAYRTEGPLATDSGLYWPDSDTLGIYHADMTAGAPAELLVDGAAPSGIGFAPTPASALGMDACNLYWLESDRSGTTRVMAIAK